MKKRLLALLAAGVIGAASLTGCGTQSTLSDTDVVATYGDIEVPAKVYNFFARYMQAQYETYYAAYLGDNMWATEAEEGVTYEQSVKNSMIENVETMLLLEQHAEEYKCTLTDDEKSKITELAEKFVENNDKDSLEAISVDKETVERALQLIAVQNKMVDALGNEADTEVSDEEAAQKAMQYVTFSLQKTDDDGNNVDMTDEEKAEVEKKAEEFAAGAKSEEDFKAYAESQEYTAEETTFDKEDVSPAEEVIAAADQMAEGEISDVIKTDSAYYVVKLTSTFDEDATESEKASIISQRKSEAYNAKVEEWKGDTESKVNEDVLAKITFVDNSVKMKTETAETEDAETAE